MSTPLPTVVLICHERSPLDLEGLASWLAATFRLVGLIVIRDGRAQTWRVARREVRRSGWLGLADVVALRVYLWLRCHGRDAAWRDREMARLRAVYPAVGLNVPRLYVRDPNAPAAREFLAALAPDLLIARCKRLLKPEVFRIPRAGSFALHPGICPEYRNAHGCFWALASGDLERVGMTLLKIDEGVDTGPVYLQATCSFDEMAETHTTIQHRVVHENLDAIGHVLRTLGSGGVMAPLGVVGRRSAVWGQPRLSAYLKWKREALRRRRHANRVVALS